MSKIQIVFLKSDEEIMSSFDTMLELRTEIRRESYLDLIRDLEKVSSYELIGAKVDGEILGVAGYRISKSIAWGKYIYVDDLITQAKSRSLGLGKLMLDHLEEYALQNNCKRLELDSGVQRFSAHRFYLRERMDILCFHFTKTLPTKSNSTV